MRPWLAASRGGRRSDSTSFGETGSPAHRGVTLEKLEPRTLLSASLAPAFAGPLPSSLTAGGHARATVRLTNSGDAPAGPAAVSLFASADASLDAGDVLLGAATRRGTVKPGRAASLKLRLDPPATLPGGSYYLIASVEGAAMPFDSATAPRAAIVASATPVPVQPSFVDLSARITRLPHGEVEVGGSGHDSLVEIEVSNAGNASAVGPVEVRLYVSADANLDAADTAAGIVPPHALKIAPGRTRTIPARLTVPAGTTPGLYYVLAVVDSSNAIAETDETNNLAASAAPISVVTAPPHDHGDGGHYHGYFGAGGYYDVGGYYDDAGYYYDDSGYVPADDGGGGDLPPDDSGPPPDQPPPISEPSTEPSDTPSTQPSDDGGAYDSGGSDWSDAGGGGWSGEPSGSYDDYSGGGSDF